MDKPLVNRVANSGIQTINLEQFYPNVEFEEIDIKDYLFKGLILREKEFRQELKSMDWSHYKNKVLLCYCSTDAIIPIWAYMLIASKVAGIAMTTFVGTREEYIKQHYMKAIGEMDLSTYEDQRIVIKGCSDLEVPPLAYALLTQHLQPHAKSIMFGEPCSTVPIWKQPRK